MIYDIQVCHLEGSKMLYTFISVASFYYTFVRTFLVHIFWFCVPDNRIN